MGTRKGRFAVGASHNRSERQAMEEPKEWASGAALLKLERCKWLLVRGALQSAQCYDGRQHDSANPLKEGLGVDRVHQRRISKRQAERRRRTRRAWVIRWRSEMPTLGAGFCAVLARRSATVGIISWEETRGPRPDHDDTSNRICLSLEKMLETDAEDLITNRCSSQSLWHADLRPSGQSARQALGRWPRARLCS